MKKPVYAICEQQRRRSACDSAQSDQRLCCSPPRKYTIFSFYIQNCKPLASFCGCAGRFESYLVANPEDRFSRDDAHVRLISNAGSTDFRLVHVYANVLVENFVKKASAQSSITL